MCAVGAGLEHEPAIAEFELEPVLDQDRRHHDAGAERGRSEVPAQLVEIVGAAGGERRRQRRVADERRAILCERGLPEQVVGMDVAREHVADRPVGHPQDRLAEPLAAARRAAAVDDRDRVGADHETDVGDPAEIRGARELVHALMDKDAGRDLGDRQRCALGFCAGSS